MKKYVFLTSVFALAACGGGGGTAVPSQPNMDLTVPDGMRSAIDSNIAKSNDKVTSMKSEVLVASAGGEPVVVRTPVSKTNGAGVTFTSYRLDDIKLYAADAVHTSDGYLQIGLNDDTGRIDKITMIIGGAGGDIERVSDDNALFNGPIFEYVADGDDEAIYRVADTGQTMAMLEELETENNLSGGHWNRVDEFMDVVTYGGNIGNGEKLQYSDFGHFNPVYKQKNQNLDADVLANIRSGTALNRPDPENSEDSLDKYRNDAKVTEELQKEDYQLFAGGYAIDGTGMDEDRPSLDPVMGATYKGKAIGRVYTSIQGDNYAQRSANFESYGIPEDDGHDMAKAFTTTEATMNISTEGGQIVENLNMPFYSHSDTPDKYYDINIKQKDGIVESVTFKAGGTEGTDETGIATQYRLYDAMDVYEDGEHAGQYKHIDMEQASFNSGYYGVNTATEAAGTAAIRADYGLSNGAKREYEVQAAWGMKKQ